MKCKCEDVQDRLCKLHGVVIDTRIELGALKHRLDLKEEWWSEVLLKGMVALSCGFLFGLGILVGWYSHG